MKNPESCPLCNHDRDELIAITGDPLGTRPIPTLTVITEVNHD